VVNVYRKSGEAKEFMAYLLFVVIFSVSEYPRLPSCTAVCERRDPTPQRLSQAHLLA
jgi:hypothetical protein